eukprot:1412210-Rhodomonas_salina.1
MYIGNSINTFVDGTGTSDGRAVATAWTTGPIAMTPPVEDATGEMSPLYVIEALFTFTEIHQTTDYPCDNNTITVTFSTNVDLLARCSPIITLTGFNKGYAAADAVDNQIPVYGRSSSNVTAVNHYLQRLSSGVNDTGTGSWNQGSYELTLFVLYDLERGALHEIQFDLINPAQGQALQTISMASDGIPITSISAGSTLLVQYADFIVNQASQVTPFPCDSNTIIVTLVSNVPLFVDCAPVVTVSGLSGTNTPDASNFTILFTGANLVQTFNGGIWSMSAGTLEFDLVSVMAAVGLSEVMDVSFEIAVVNGAASQASPGVLAEGYITNTVGNEETRTWTDSVASDSTIAHLSYTDKSVNSAVSGDAFPLFIAAHGFEVKTIGQSSPYPCDTNSITATITSWVPLFVGWCQPQIVISGLTGTATMDNNALAIVPSDGAVLESAAIWRRDTGSATINITATVIAGTSYEVQIDLVNDRNAQASPDIYIHAYPIVMTPVPEYMTSDLTTLAAATGSIP